MDRELPPELAEPEEELVREEAALAAVLAAEAEIRHETAQAGQEQEEQAGHLVELAETEQQVLRVFLELAAMAEEAEEPEHRELEEPAAMEVLLAEAEVAAEHQRMAVHQEQEERGLTARLL